MPTIGVINTSRSTSVSAPRPYGWKPPALGLSVDEAEADGGGVEAMCRLAGVALAGPDLPRAPALSGRGWTVPLFVPGGRLLRNSEMSSLSLI